jgi:hypothetical protein
MDFSTLDNNFTMRWQSTALLALQEATEAYLVHLFEDAYVHSFGCLLLCHCSFKDSLEAYNRLAFRLLSPFAIHDVWLIATCVLFTLRE